MGTGLLGFEPPSEILASRRWNRTRGYLPRTSGDWHKRSKCVLHLLSERVLDVGVRYTTALDVTDRADDSGTPFIPESFQHGIRFA